MEKSVMKKIIIFVILLLVCAFTLYYFAILKPTKQLEYPLEDMNGEAFRITGDPIDRKTLSEDAWILQQNVDFQNGQTGVRELLYWEKASTDLLWFLPAEENCVSGGAYWGYQDENGTYTKYLKDFFVLYRIQSKDGDVVFCVVSPNPYVEDTADSNQVQFRRDNLYYTYFLTKEFKPGYEITHHGLAFRYEINPDLSVIGDSEYREYQQWFKQSGGQSGDGSPIDP